MAVTWLGAHGGSRIIIAGTIIAAGSHLCALIQATIVIPRRVDLVLRNQWYNFRAGRHRRLRLLASVSAISAISRLMIVKPVSDCPTMRTQEQEEKGRETGGDLKIGWWHSFQWLGVSELGGDRARHLRRCTDTACTWRSAESRRAESRSLFPSREDACQNRLFRLSRATFRHSFADLLSNFNKHALQTAVRFLKRTLHTGAGTLLLRWFAFDFSLAV